MHLSKGLEFRAVVVMACDDEVVPLQERIETVADEADLEDQQPCPLMLSGRPPPGGGSATCHAKSGMIGVAIARRRLASGGGRVAVRRVPKGPKRSGAREHPVPAGQTPKKKSRRNQNAAGKYHQVMATMSVR